MRLAYPCQPELADMLRANSKSMNETNRKRSAAQHKCFRGTTKKHRDYEERTSDYGARRGVETKLSFVKVCGFASFFLKDKSLLTSNKWRRQKCRLVNDINQVYTYQSDTFHIPWDSVLPFQALPVQLTHSQPIYAAHLENATKNNENVDLIGDNAQETDRQAGPYTKWKTTRPTCIESINCCVILILLAPSSFFI